MSSDQNWYKDAIIYELHIKAFFDGNNDGIGDFKGLIKKLDYLRDLGVTAIWVLPFYPSPLRDDGYDIADYYGVHPNYGTIKEFKRFLKEAHARNLKVITEIVLNHTSDQHPWFQRARRAPEGSVERDYYVWSKTIHKYEAARIIFEDFERSNWTWDDEAQAYYWHRFYFHQPDLNYDSPLVCKEVFKVIDYWLEMGVDGFRLDAVPYLYQREGTNCENLPETHLFLKKLRAHVDTRSNGATMLLAEANQWPEDAIKYFGEGNECNMCFHFPVMPRLFMAIEMEDKFPITDIMEQTPEIPPNCQWGLFLRNHDELTLEMVSDEERDYMHRTYAKDPRTIVNLGLRRRLAPLLNNDRRKIELMHIMLFSLPGTPFVYYGDEIGMGDNIYLGDRDGVRTPMQWDASKNAGFSDCNPQQLYLPLVNDPVFHHSYVNVENCDRNSSSLLWWMRQVILVRKLHAAFGRGTMAMVHTENQKVLAFLRSYEESTILVVINLSRFAQDASLELELFDGHTPMELFSQNTFHPITQTPYRMSITPYGYYWLNLEKPNEDGSEPSKIVKIEVAKSWHEIFEDDAAVKFTNSALRNYLKKAHWYGIHSRSIYQIRIIDTIALSRVKDAPILMLYQITYQDDTQEQYLMPLNFDYTSNLPQGVLDSSDAPVCTLMVGNKEGCLYDAVYSEQFRSELLTIITKYRSLTGKKGRLEVVLNERLKHQILGGDLPEKSQIMSENKRHVHIDFGKQFFGKLHRKLEDGIPPDREMTQFLTDKQALAHIPAFIGAIDYYGTEPKQSQVLLIKEYINDVQDAFVFVRDSASRFIDEVLSKKPKAMDTKGGMLYRIGMDAQEVPPAILEYAGDFIFEMIELLGVRIGDMHVALASKENNFAFAPRKLTELYLRSHYQSFRNTFRRVCQNLRNQKILPVASLQEGTEMLLDSEKEVLEWFQAVYEHNVEGLKIRTHDNLKLNNILFMGKDFIIIDFGGNEEKSISERRLKRTVFSDVASIIYSMNSAIHEAIWLSPNVSEFKEEALMQWRDELSSALISVFLNAYVDTVSSHTLLVPKQHGEFERLLDMALFKRVAVSLQRSLDEKDELGFTHAISFGLRLLDSIRKGK